MLDRLWQSLASEIRPSVVAAILVFLVTSPAKAAESKHSLEYDHLAGGAKAYTVRAKNGDVIKVTITNTCPEQFEYKPLGYLTPAGQPADRTKPGVMRRHVFEIVHDTKYGGYVVSLTKKAVGQPCTGTGGDQLADQTFLISVQEDHWDLSVAGGFTISTLRSPIFAIRADPDGKTRRVVEESDDEIGKEKQDDVTLGLAAFIQPFYTGWPHLSPTFGFGIRDDNKFEYFVGGAWRMNDKAAISFGRMWGPVTRLPDGTRPGDLVTDDNILANLPSRNQGAWFVAFSFSFLDVRGRLDKPFAGAERNTDGK